MIVLPSRDERIDGFDCNNYGLQNSLSDRHLPIGGLFSAKWRSGVEN
jgi:hypothetical protein